MGNTWRDYSLAEKALIVFLLLPLAPLGIFGLFLSWPIVLVTYLDDKFGIDRTVFAIAILGGMSWWFAILAILLILSY